MCILPGNRHILQVPLLHLLPRLLGEPRGHEEGVKNEHRFPLPALCLMHCGESDVPNESGHSLVLVNMSSIFAMSESTVRLSSSRDSTKNTQACCFIVNSLGRSVFRDCFIYLPPLPQAKAFGEILQASCTHLLNEGYKRCPDVFSQDFARHVSLQECICHAYKWSTVPTQDHRSWCEILCNIRRKCLHFPFWCVGMWFYVRCFHLCVQTELQPKRGLEDQVCKLLFVI